MKKHLIAIAALTALTVLPAGAAPNIPATDHRPFYGYYLRNPLLPDHGYGMEYFDGETYPVLLHKCCDDNTVGLYAGAAVDGLMYGYEYRFISSLEPPQPSDFVSYNIHTGEKKVIAPWKAEYTFSILDMTYDYKNKVMYAMCYDYGAQLHTVNLETGELTLVTKLEGGGPVAANLKGELYTITNPGILCRINLSNGNLEPLFDTGMHTLYDLQSMEFDHTSGKLYWGANSYDYDRADGVYMEEIDLSDPSDITIRELFNLGSGVSFRSLYIPYASSFAAPAAPSDITATPDSADPFKVTLSWTNPTATFGGGELEGIDGVVIFRNGEVIKFFDTATKGEKMTYTDSSATENAEYRYDIVAFNGEGDGEKGLVYQYLGFDRPDRVAGLSGDVSVDMKSVTLSWTAPSKGFHNGVIDPSKTTYKIVRRPDGTSLDLKDLKVEGDKVTFTDNTVRRLLRYSYEVTSCNDQGESTAYSDEYILGPAMELPYDEAFEDLNAFKNRWSYYDGNNDSFSWLFCTTLGYSTFGDAETGAEYIISPTLVDETLKDADEWLISPPLSFEAGKEYEIRVRVRTYTDETLEIHTGINNTVEAMSICGEPYAITPGGINATTGTRDFREYVFPCTPAAPGTGCVGIRLTSPVNSRRNSFVQISRMSIATKGTYQTGIADTTADNAAKINISGRHVSILGDFDTATLYTPAGVTAASWTEAEHELDTLAPGVYILSVSTPAGDKTVKVALH